MKTADLKCFVLDCFIEEDLISEDELNSAGSEVQIKRLELKHDAREQEKNRECQLRMKELNRIRNATDWNLKPKLYW